MEEEDVDVVYGGGGADAEMKFLLVGLPFALVSLTVRKST